MLQEIIRPMIIEQVGGHLTILLIQSRDLRRDKPLRYVLPSSFRFSVFWVVSIFATVSLQGEEFTCGVELYDKIMAIIGWHNSLGIGVPDELDVSWWCW